MTNENLALKPFTEIRYVTKDGEQISATKQNGVVTLNGDKNGVRQIPIEQFEQEFLDTVQNVNLEKTPTKDEVNFKGKKEPKLVNIQEGSDFQIRTYETDATSGKKWGVGVASGFLPGLGQAINGQWGKAVGFFLGTGVLQAGTFLAAARGKKPLAIASGVASLGAAIWGIVDAVKSARSKTTEIVH